MRPLYGNGWFTFYITNGSGAPLSRSGVGRVTSAGAITLFFTPTGDACRAFEECGITVGPDNKLWIVETNANKVAKITLTGQITEVFTLNQTTLPATARSSR